MSVTYAEKKRSEAPERNTEALQQPSFDALRAGAAAPTQEQMGHRVDLPGAIREKMENAFGADLSAVKLYESRAVDEAGVKAVAQGSNIAFAPGALDFTSYGGQALLGHEISHVVSQARGEVTGSGLLNDQSLEARADREGAMAAAGQRIAVPTEALSPVTAAPAAGPMQCFRKGKKKYEPLQKIDLKNVGKVNTNLSPYDISSDDLNRDKQFQSQDRAGFDQELIARYTNGNYDQEGLRHLNNGRDVRIDGLDLNRLAVSMTLSLGEGYSKEQITQMFDNLMAPHFLGLDRTNEAAVNKSQSDFDEGMKMLKDMQYNKLKRMEATYGTLPTQLHPRDFIQLAGNRYNDHFHMAQDTQQLLTDGSKYFDMNDPKDREMKELNDYYFTAVSRNHAYAITEATEGPGNPFNPDMMDSYFARPNATVTPQMEAAVHGPSLSSRKQKSYLKDLHKRFDASGWSRRLFGRFRKFNDPKRLP